jgi:hypothetical protein
MGRVAHLVACLARTAAVIPSDRPTGRPSRLLALSIGPAIAAGAVAAPPCVDAAAAADVGGRPASARSASRVSLPGSASTRLRPRRRSVAADKASLRIGDGSRFTRSRSTRVVVTVPDPEGADREYELVERDAFTGIWTA